VMIYVVTNVLSFTAGYLAGVLVGRTLGVR
jgi:hypothetical protein